MQALDLYAEGYTTEEVGRRVSPRVSQAVVRSILKRHRVKLRSQSEAYEAKRAQHDRWEAAYKADGQAHS